MNIAEYTITNKTLSAILILLTVAGGWSAYRSMPRFEDPEFTIRIAQVTTRYDGASPGEVADEVTRPLETSIQQMQEVDSIRSFSSHGLSRIEVEIKYAFSPDKRDLQLVWNKLRNRVGDAALPPGADAPVVNDDFGNVYGLYYFLTGDGYTPAELRSYAKEIRDELLQVDGVAQVALLGERREAVYVEVSRERAAALGVSLPAMYELLERQNAVAPAGDLRLGERRVFIQPSGVIDSVAAISNLLAPASSSSDGDGALVRLRDIATVTRDYRTPPERIVRYNGEPAIGIGVAGVSGGNIVSVGETVSAKLAESESRRPLGMDMHEFYHQGKVVASAINNFLLNVAAALAIVMVSLLIFMGARPAAVMGLILLLTTAATLAVMFLSGIPMHRISLGALIISLGMMVDNGVVVTEGILVGVQQGRDKLAAAVDVVNNSNRPLLSGTLVGVTAFAPIGFAPGDTAEYTGHLFWVILIALFFSWFFALTLTPLFCHILLRKPKHAATAEHPILTHYKKFLRRALGARVVTVAAIAALFAVSLWGFGAVKNGFFPSSTTPQFVIDYTLPEGADISRTAADMTTIETFVAGIDGVNAVQTLAGGGGLRHILVYAPEANNSAYGQIIARVDDYKKIDAMMPRIRRFIDDTFPDARAKVWRFVLGPGGGAKIEAAFSGPDPAVLRGLAERAKAVMRADGGIISVADDWGRRVNVIEPGYSQDKGARAGVTREDVARALQTNFSGRQVGVYREGDDLLPIISRAPPAERVRAEDMRDIQVLSSASGAVTPITQVTDGFRTLWRNGKLLRENQVWKIQAQGDPVGGELASVPLARIRPLIEAIPLPDGYRLKWEGEYGDSQDANDDLATTLPLGVTAMALIVFVFFGNVREPLVIWSVVPLAVIGVVAGLVVTATPLEFMGILGILSLSGLLIQNSIVLVDQMNLQIRSGTPRLTAVIESAASRMRPVMMGSFTTVLGVIPLLFDAFFRSMSVVLIFGLAFATLITLLIVPVLYAMFFNITGAEVVEAE